MAAAFEGQIKETLTCKVCYQVLNNPKTLPCMHTYCCDCLRKLVTNEADENTVKCPECRQVHKIPEKGLDDFKVSYMAKTLVEIFDAAETDGAPICKNCKVKRDADINAVAKCLECNKDVCRSCLDNHDEFIQGHTIVDLTGDKSHDMQRALATAKDRTIHCPKHNTALQIYCKIDKCVICPTCYVISHSGHDCIDIHQAADDNVEQIKELLIQGAKLVTHYETAMDDIHRAKDIMETEMNDAVNELTNDMNAALKHIRDTYMQNINIITEKRDTCTKQTIAHLGNIELKKSLIETTMKQMSTVKEYGHNAELANLASEIQLKRKEWKNVPSVTFDVNGKVKVHKGGLYTDRIVFASVDDGSRRSKNNDTSWRKLLSMLHWVLTEGGAEKLGITVYEDGSAYVHEILALCRDLQGFTIEDVKYAIANDERQSFDWDLYSGDKKPIVWAKAQKKLPKPESQMPIGNRSNAIAANSHHNNITATHQQQQQQFRSAVQTNKCQNNSSFVPISPGVLQLLREEKSLERSKKIPISIRPQKGEPTWKVQKLVKTLDFLLSRGGAESKGLSLDDDGTLPVGDFQAHEQFSCYKMGDIHNAVACSNNTLILEKISRTGQIFIRAVNNTVLPTRENHNKTQETRSESDQSKNYASNYKNQQQSIRVPDIPLSEQSSTYNKLTPRKKEKVDPDVKLPKILKFLFYKDGISEKNFKLNQDGFVCANDILECYSDFTLKDLKRVISADSGENYITLTDSFTQTLLLKAARDPPSKQSDSYIGYTTWPE